MGAGHDLSRLFIQIQPAYRQNDHKIPPRISNGNLFRRSLAKRRSSNRRPCKPSAYVLRCVEHSLFNGAVHRLDVDVCINSCDVDCSHHTTSGADVLLSDTDAQDGLGSLLEVARCKVGDAVTDAPV